MNHALDISMQTKNRLWLGLRSVQQQSANDADVEMEWVQ